MICLLKQLISVFWKPVSFLSPCFRNVFKIQDTCTICVYTYTHIYKILMLLYTCVCR